MAIGCRSAVSVGDEHRRARRRGKSFELLVAKALGGTRPRGGNRGVASSDIDGVPWSVEVTRTNQGESAVRKKWAQCCKNAKAEGREPLLIVAKPRQRLNDALVVCRFGLFHSLVQGGTNGSVVLSESQRQPGPDFAGVADGVGRGEVVDGDVGVVDQDGADEAEL